MTCFHPLRVLLPSLLLLAPSVALGEGIPQLGKDFPNPTVWEGRQGTIDTTSKALGIPVDSPCGSRNKGWTTSQPLVRFEVKETFRAILYVEQVKQRNYTCFNILGPGGASWGTKASFSSGPQLLFMEFKPGEYRVHLSISSTYDMEDAVKNYSGVTYRVHLVDPSRPYDDAPYPVATIGASFQNPTIVQGVQPGDIVEKGRGLGFDSGSDCGDSQARASLVPAFVLDVKEKVEATVLLQASGDAAYIRHDGKLFCVGTKINDVWAPGRYEFHLINGKAGERFQVQVYDEKRPVSLAPDTLQQAVDSLARPVWIAGQVNQDALTTDRRDFEGRCEGVFPVAPQVVFEVPQGTRKLDVRLFDPSDSLVFMVESMGRGYRTKGSCQGREVLFKEAGGRYGVWVGRREGTKVRAKSFDLILSAEDTKVDPLEPYAKIPDDLEPRYRIVGWWLPFFKLWTDDASLQTMDERMVFWKRLPEKLRVYATKDLDASTAKVLPGDSGEPDQKLGQKTFYFPKANELLMVFGQDRSSGWLRVETVDGVRFVVPPAALATAPSGPVFLPAKPRIHWKVNWRAGSTYKAPKVRKARKAFELAEKRFVKCWDRFWAKHPAVNAFHKQELTRKGEIVCKNRQRDRRFERYERLLSNAQYQEHTKRLARLRKALLGGKGAGKRGARGKRRRRSR